MYFITFLVRSEKNANTYLILADFWAFFFISLWLQYWIGTGPCSIKEKQRISHNVFINQQKVTKEFQGFNATVHRAWIIFGNKNPVFCVPQTTLWQWSKNDFPFIQANTANTNFFLLKIQRQSKSTRSQASNVLLLVTTVCMSQNTTSGNISNLHL